MKDRQEKGHELTEGYLTREYIGTKYDQYTHIFTDASKDPQSGRVGIAYIIPSLDVLEGKRISNHLSVFTGELLAIMLAVNKVYEMDLNKSIICSDSTSALLCLDIKKSETRQDIIIEILQLLQNLEQKNKIVEFVWVPAHSGVEGNEAADRLAKTVMAKERIEMKIRYSRAELKSVIKKGIHKKWQISWDNEQKGRHLYAIQPKVGQILKSWGSRKEDCILSRIRIGHTGLNATLHMIGKHPTGLCDGCGERETVEHVIISCNKYTEERNMLINDLQINDEQITLKEFLYQEGKKWLIQFLKRTQLIHRI